MSKLYVFCREWILGSEAYGTSEGVTGSDGGGGRLMKVCGWFDMVGELFGCDLDESVMLSRGGIER